MTSSPKTTRTEINPLNLINTITESRIKTQSIQLLDFFVKVTGFKPVVWGSKIIGFGEYEYTYSSGNSGTWPLTAFAAGKNKITIYIMPGFENFKEHLDKLGKHKTGKSCLYITDLSKIDLQVLEEIVRQSVREMQQKYPSDK